MDSSIKKLQLLQSILTNDEFELLADSTTRKQMLALIPDIYLEKKVDNKLKAGIRNLIKPILNGQTFITRRIQNENQEVIKNQVIKIAITSTEIEQLFGNGGNQHLYKNITINRDLQNALIGVIDRDDNTFFFYTFNALAEFLVANNWI